MIYITGANGQLGKDLAKVLGDNRIEYRVFEKDQWDVCDEQAGRKILSSGECTALVNCAAYTAVDKAESEKEVAFQLNGEAPGVLKRLAFEAGVYFVHISTDFVFSESSRRANVPHAKIAHGENEQPKDLEGVKPWKTTDEPEPGGVYAQSKLLGEHKIIEQNKKNGLPDFAGVSIIRTSWVYTSHGKNFPLTMIRLAGDEKRDRLTVVEDQIGRPSYAFRIARFVWKVLEKKGLTRKISDAGKPGENNGDLARIPGELLHFSNEGVASWYDFAKATIDMANELGILNRKIPVLPIPSEAYPTPAPRPSYSVLDLATARKIDPEIPHWRDDLRIMLQRLLENPDDLSSLRS